MPATDGLVRPAREKTDESLRTEREKADRALASTLFTIEKATDGVVDRAREDADGALNKAHDETDRKLEGAESPGETRAVIADERAVEKEALDAERATADETRSREREQHARALAALLPLERHRTDRNLLTERVRSDEALSHRDDFLILVSHDLRNLLSGIVYSVQVLEESAAAIEDADDLASGAKRIQHYAARMNRLIGDLVDVASIETGKLTVVPGSGDAAELVVEAVEVFASLAAEKGITLEAKLAVRPLLGEFDHDRLLQVLANLITNAVKFSAPGGRIWVRAEPVSGGLLFCVGDTGSGIPEGMLEAIFERFWQVGKNDRRGLGLGLYISRQLIEAHGGRIWAESRMGEGSELYFTIPLPGATAA